MNTFFPHYQFSAALPAFQLQTIQRAAAPARADSVHFTGRLAKVAKPYTGIKRLGVLVTPEKIKCGEIRLENPDQVPFDLEHLVSTTNPGVYDAGREGVYIMVRAIVGKDYGKAPAKSYQLVGHMPDGKTLKSLRLLPALAPSETPVPGSRQVSLTYGLEDVRITRAEDGQYYLVGNGYNGRNCYMTLFRTPDLMSGPYETLGVIGPNGIDPQSGLSGSENNIMNKDGLLHPEKVNGQWLLYQRIVPDMQVARADRLEDFMSDAYWENLLKPESLKANTVLTRQDGTWQTRLGWGGPPIKTRDGWLHIFHASNVKDDGSVADSGHGPAGKKTYCAGVMLTALDDPTRVISRCPLPLMVPETEAERIGPVGNVIFPQGYRVKGDKLLIYYGAADDKVGMAQTSLKNLLRYVKGFDAEGRVKPQKPN